MTRSTGKSLAPLLAIPLLLASALNPVTGQDPPASAEKPMEPPTAAPTEEALRAALDEKLNLRVEAHFDNIPLRDSVGYIAAQIQVDAIFDTNSIEDEGLNIDAPATLHIEHTPVSARQVLREILDPHGLAIINDNGLLKVATKTLAEETLHTRLYDMQTILDHALARGEFRNYLKDNQHLAGAHPSRESELKTTALIAFAEVIQETTSGPWLYIDGIGGTISYMDDQLIVMQTDNCHREIASILRQWRENQLNRNTSPTPPDPAATLPPSHEIPEQQK